MSETRPLPERTLCRADGAATILVASLALTLAVTLWGRGEGGLPLAPLVFGGWLAGLLAPRLYPQPWRVLGLVPWALLAALIAAAVARWLSDWPGWLAVMAIAQGLSLGAVLRYRDRARAHGVRFTLFALLGVVLGVAALGVYSLVGHAEPEWREGYFYALIGVLAFAALVTAAWFFRPAGELVVEVGMRLLYRESTAGPGAAKVPVMGPCLVIANHAAWFDPLFIAEAVPRQTTPMMSAGFYDLPLLRWWMRDLWGVIRVPEVALRRDAPELQEAVRALDRGECVVIFPEGYLRRGEEPVMRRFGQGVWQILRDRPQTPVVPCWIEGSWGSYFSHKGGPPTKNKRFDFRRRIRVAVGEPFQTPTEVLAEHLVARVYLMNKVLETRQLLGLPAVPAVELPTRGGEGAEASEAT